MRLAGLKSRSANASSEFNRPRPTSWCTARSRWPSTPPGLALGLAIVDLMSVPAKVRANRSRPTGYLGLVVGTEAGRH